MCTPSPLHGVTTVVGGNCGFTIAPLGDAGDVDYVMRMMARVEGMSIDALRAGPAWDWRTFGEWLDRIDGRLGVNAGFLVGHSTMRRLVMGDAAVHDAATPEQIAAMVALAHDAMASGALGVSSSLGEAHTDGDGNPVPSRAASHDELLALRTRGARPRGHDARVHRRDGRDRRRSHRADDRHVARGQPPAELEPAREPLPHRGLRAAAHVVRPRHRARRARRRAHAARPDAAAREPHPRRPPGLARRRSRSGPTNGAGRSPTRRRERRCAPVRRKRRAAASARSPSPSCSRSPTRPPGRRRSIGRSIADIAAERGADPVDVLIDVVLPDRLPLTMVFPSLVPSLGRSDEGWRVRAGVWHDDRTVLGGSDAGAHADLMCHANYTTMLLGESVRDRALLTLEEAVRQLTDVPARLYGLRDRGRVAEGWIADLVVFDPARVGSGPAQVRHDLPGGGERLYAEAQGIEHVLVNGREIVAGGRLTGDLAGTLLRSGRDTDTVTVPARRREQQHELRQSRIRHRREPWDRQGHRGVARPGGLRRRDHGPDVGGGRGARALVDAEGVGHVAAARQPVVDGGARARHGPRRADRAGRPARPRVARRRGDEGARHVGSRRRRRAQRALHRARPHGPVPRHADRAAREAARRQRARRARCSTSCCSRR